MGRSAKPKESGYVQALNIRGRIMAFTGNEGLQYATDEVFDLDKGGNGDDEIFTGSTDANGYVQGQSSEWVDRNTVKINPPACRHQQRLKCPTRWC